MTITQTFNDGTSYTAIAKRYEEFIIVTSKDYTKVLTPNEFRQFVKEKGFKIV